MQTVGPGVREIRIREALGAFRIIYLAALEDRVLVLHAFKKKTQTTSKKDLDLAAPETMEGRTMNVEIYENVWDVLADTEQEAANLKARSALLYEIRKAVQRWNISQEEAGKRLGLTRPRTNDLLRGKLAKFSLDALVNIAASAHLDIEIRIKDAA